MSKAAPTRLTYRWDLDKTYLHTEFDTFRGLVRIPFESAADKVAAPGVAALIRGLRASAERRGVEVRVRFVSGSPPQIGKAILEKLALDGIAHEGITFKDQWSRIRRGKFRALREQVGYKLTELLHDRRREPPGTAEYLFGDDWESDPLIYSLYADVISGAIDREELCRILLALHVDPDLAAVADELVERLSRDDAVQRIFINLARRTPPRDLEPYGPRLVPTFNYLQTAACLFEEGVLDMPAVSAVVAALRDDHGYDTRRMVNSLRDIERRRHLNAAGAAMLAKTLRDNSALPEFAQGRSRWRDAWLRVRRRLAGVPVATGRRADYARLLPAPVGTAAGEEVPT
jgi:hypothetical protein